MMNFIESVIFLILYAAAMLIPPMIFHARYPAVTAGDVILGIVWAVVMFVNIFGSPGSSISPQPQISIFLGVISIFRFMMLGEDKKA